MPPNLSPQSHSRTFLNAISLLSILLLLLHHSHRASSAIILSLKNRKTSQHHRRQPMFQSNMSTCALFAGTWVRDDSYPLYEPSDCPLIDAQFNCQMYGRPDKDYLKYRWRPLNCELPRFDGEEFLRRMSGKTVMFVGDSLGRNQWESLICLISASARDSQTQMIRGDPLSTFKFLDYGVSLSFYRAPYLVDIGVSHGRRILRLDHISANAADWLSADVISFNSGHWWTHTGSLQGWEYMESGGQYYQDMDRVAALDKGLRTWANWVDSNVDRSKTRVFFLSISPTHYNPGEWNTGSSETERSAGGTPSSSSSTTTTTRTSSSSTKNCYGETSPTRGASSYTAGTYPEQMRVVDTVIRGMHTPISLMDITLLSALRKDGHPSIYSGDLSPQQRANPARSADCSHWCLPGLPDTWNQLFYTALVY